MVVNELSIKNSGYVDKHAIILIEELNKKGFKCAILVLPIATLSFQTMLLKEKKISVRNYFLSLLTCSIFLSKISFKIVFNSIGHLFESSWKANNSLKIIFSKTKSIKESKRVIINSSQVAFYMKGINLDNPNVYYIIYHNHENDIPSISMIIEDGYNSFPRKIVTNEDMLTKFHLNSQCLMVPAIKKDKMSLQDKIVKEANSVCIPLRKNPIKGASVAIEAIKLSLELNKDLKFYTFGDYQWNISSERCIHLGVVTEAKLKQLYSISEIFVLPSIEDGVPGPAVEAMSYGCATICTNVSGAKEIIKDGFNGKIIPINDAKIMASTIVDLVSNKDLVRYLSSNAKGISKKFSEENMVETFLNGVSFYEKAS